ncbi:hypothetical protein [Streptomyces sp. NPDC002845]
MSRIEWQWRDEGSGPGHMQRVSVHDEDDVTRARRVLRAHLAACSACTGPEQWCPASERLYAAYQRTKEPVS